MRILHTVEFYHPSVGGTQTVAQLLSERLAALGHEVIALEVDEDNPHKALQLYESVGFRTVARSTAFRKRL